MKSLLLFICMSFISSAQSQTKTFVRIFDENGKKINNGYLLRTSDSTLTLSSNENIFEIPIAQISVIKLRRSFGETVLFTSLIAAGSLALLGASTSDPDSWFGYTAGEGALVGFILGAGAGAITGTIISGTRSRPIFEINRNQDRWIKAKPMLDSYLPIQPKEKRILFRNTP